ncbi:hypothetical protein [Pararobbsia alpina]|uniref:Glutamine--fructose-6-phosphate aminotransferase [isomerizing] n=1 Tax=Pararobbsia alpina TaxID=621374 RepID=A0A6S7BWH4_9BURK|nr:hypothetical protein LMG28138_04995 [Pararobbsia alpina]
MLQNGIIETYEPLRTMSIGKGYEFVSQTDTEIGGIATGNTPVASATGPGRDRKRVSIPAPAESSRTLVATSSRAEHTLAALKHAQATGHDHTLAICNVANSDDACDQMVILDEGCKRDPLPVGGDFSPRQLLACHAACIRGTDADNPRNLAKSVTVD